MLRGALLACVAILVFSGGGRQAGAQEEPGSSGEPSFRTTAEEEFAPDRIIVKLRENVPQRALDALNRQNGARTDRVFPDLRLGVIDLPRELPVEAAIRRYERSPDVEYAEPDFVLRPSEAVMPDDTQFPELYGLNNTGQNSGTPDADIDAPEAWTNETGSSNTVVAVIDTGVDIRHEDLQGNIWTNPGEIPDNGIDDDLNGYVDDVNGWDFYNGDNTVYDPDLSTSRGDEHGTHVAGTIAAVGNNGVGVTGVNWDAQIMPLKFIGPDGGFTSGAIAALNYAVLEGAPISNNSWGGGGSSQALKDAIDTADLAGHLFVAAAGNGGSDGAGDDNDATPFYPASYNSANIISVAATNNNDDLASFSNFGDQTVDLGAPGVRILSTLPGSTYGSYSGTSMATPHVAGVAALIRSSGLILDDSQLKDRILGSAEPVPSLQNKTVTGARLNAANALGARVTELTFGASPLLVIYPKTTTLSGRLTANGEPLGGQKVNLQQRPYGARDYSTFSSVTTVSDGTFRLANIRPLRHTNYRARFEGNQSQGLDPSTSSGAAVKSRVQTYLNVASTDLKLGSGRTISGSVAPNHPGKTVTVRILRDGKFLTNRTATLNVNSRYAFAYKPPTVGRYTFRALFPKDADHYGNVSPYRSFRVVR